jgi:hypothetical protein
VHAEPFIGCSNFYFQNCLPPFLAWANGMATPEKRKIPSHLPKKNKTGPSLVQAKPFIRCMQLLFPKLFATIFGVG